MISAVIAFTLGFVAAIGLAYFNMLRGFKTYQEEAKLKLQFYAEQRSIAKLKYEQMRAMSHHLLTPLHGIRGLSDNLSTSQLNEEQRSSVRSISENANEIFSYLRGVCQFEANEEVTEEITEFPSANILLVEDDPLNQKIATSYLNRVEVHPDLAKTGREAIQMVQKKSYDIVIMDLSMPDLDGIEATRTIRKLPQVPKSMVIIGLTANSSHETREACLFAGMNDYLSKPATAQQILHCLQKWLPQSSLRRNRNAAASNLSLEDTLDQLEIAFEHQDFPSIEVHAQAIIVFCEEMELDSLKKYAEKLIQTAHSKDISLGINSFVNLKHSLQFVARLSLKKDAA